MITQKDLERTQFFTVDGTDFWRVVETRVVTELTLKNIETSDECICIVGADFEPFLPITMPQIKKDRPVPQNRKTIKLKVTNMNEAARIAARINKDAGKGPKKERKPGKNKKSIYKGVSPAKPNSSGVVRYHSTYWDGKKGKAAHLGTFGDELEAAAVYQDHIGDKAEAARLRALAGQSAAEQKIRPGKKMRGKYVRRSGPVARDPSNERQASSDGPKHIPGLRGPREKASKYKGVSIAKPRKDGTQLWRAQSWENGKLVSLGQFESDLLAAAAYAEHKGEQTEAERLRALAGQSSAGMTEQAENNPDRARQVTIYICAHCKNEWKSKPDRCPHCDGATFTPKKVDEDKV